MRPLNLTRVWRLGLGLFMAGVPLGARAQVPPPPVCDRVPWAPEDLARFYGEAPRAISFRPAVVMEKLGRMEQEFLWSQRGIATTEIATWYYLRGMATWWSSAYRDGEVPASVKSEVLSLFIAARVADPTFPGMPELDGGGEDVLLWQRAEQEARHSDLVDLSLNSPSQSAIYVDGRSYAGGPLDVQLSAGRHLVQVPIKDSEGQLVGYVGRWIDVRVGSDGFQVELPTRNDVPCTGWVGPFDPPWLVVASSPEPEPRPVLQFHPQLSVWYLNVADSDVWYVSPTTGLNMSLGLFELGGRVGVALGSARSGAETNLLIPLVLSVERGVHEDFLSVGMSYHAWLAGDPGGVLHSFSVLGRHQVKLTPSRSLTVSAEVGVGHQFKEPFAQFWDPVASVGLGLGR